MRESADTQNSNKTDRVMHSLRTSSPKRPSEHVKKKPTRDSNERKKNAARNFPEFEKKRIKAARKFVVKYEGRIKSAAKSGSRSRTTRYDLKEELQYSYAKFIDLCAQADREKLCARWANDVDLREKHGCGQALSIALAKFVHLSGSNNRQYRSRDAAAIRFLIYENIAVRRVVERLGKSGGITGCAKKWRKLNA